MFKYHRVLGNGTSIPPQRAVPPLLENTERPCPFFFVHREAFRAAMPLGCVGRKAFNSVEPFGELLRQASLHNEAVQEPWTALYFVAHPGGLSHRRDLDSSGVDPHASPFDAKPAFGEEPHRERQQDVFLLEDPSGEGVFRIVL